MNKEPVELKISMTNLFFYQCESCVNLCLKYLGVLCALGGNKQKMQNEPNFCKKNPNTHLLIYPFTHLLIDSIMSNEPNLKTQKPATHFTTSNYNKKQRTIPALPALSTVEGSSVEGNNEHCTNEPNPVLSEVEWISQIAHLNNKQPTTNNEYFPNEPNFKTPKLA